MSTPQKYEVSDHVTAFPAAASRDDATSFEETSSSSVAVQMHFYPQTKTWKTERVEERDVSGEGGIASFSDRVSPMEFTTRGEKREFFS